MVNRLLFGSATPNKIYCMSISPEDLKILRKRAGLTQTEAAHLVRSKLRTWQSWEAASNLPTARKIPDGLVELFCIKVGISYRPK